MVSGMASAKVTVTIPREHLATIRELVAAGHTPSVSGFVQHAVALALDDLAGWQALLAEALANSGGPLTEAERAWADQVLSSGTPHPSAAA